MVEKKRGPGRPPGSKNKNTATTSKSKATSGKDPYTKKQRKVQEAQVRSKTGSRVRDEIWALIILALGVFLLIALQTATAGEFGIILSKFFKGCFGIIAYVLPYYIILYGILLFAKQTVHITARSIFFLMIIFLMVAIINASRFIDPTSLELWPMTFGLFFDNGVALTGGGLIGTVFAELLIKAFGKVGLWIFALLVICICLLLVINTPVSQFIEGMREKRARRKAGILEEAEYVDSQEDLASVKVDTIKTPPLKARTQGEIEKERLEKQAQEKEKEQLEQEIVQAQDFHEMIINTQENESSYVPGKMSENQLKILRMMNDDSLFEQEEKSVSGKGLEGTSAFSQGFGLGDHLGEESEKQTPTREDKSQESDGIQKATKSVVKGKYEFPPISLLSESVAKKPSSDSQDLREKAKKLEDTLRNFNVGAKVVQVTQGPTVTRYEIQPDVGVKVSSITRLADDIALNLEAKSIRLEAPIPGKAAVGIEVENESLHLVSIRDMISSKEFKAAKSKIAFPIGKDLSGTPIIADLKEMPHLLIAGSTGSGKSVCINAILTSILYKATPEEVRLVLIDPKVVELGGYNGIPHLLIPVVTDPNKAAAALNWAVTEMTDRYKHFAEVSVRDLAHFNEKMRKNKEDDKCLPQIVIIIDELADLMMAAPNKVEESICRLAQMARAAGMHLIVATQRPSVDIITGVIKANIPSRIAFSVSSQFDSRTILDMAGAEKLVGKGDMLFNPQSLNKPIRVQGSFISDGDVAKVIEFVKSQGSEIGYQDGLLSKIEKSGEKETIEDNDELMDEAIEAVIHAKQASVSMLQRRFRIGYNRAARMIDQMEARDIIGPADGSRPRQVIWTEVDYYAMKGIQEEEDEDQ